MQTCRFRSAWTQRDVPLADTSYATVLRPAGDPVVAPVRQRPMRGRNQGDTLSHAGPVRQSGPQANRFPFGPHSEFPAGESLDPERRPFPTLAAEPQAVRPFGHPGIGRKDLCPGRAACRGDDISLPDRHQQRLSLPRLASSPPAVVPSGPVSAPASEDAAARHEPFRSDAPAGRRLARWNGCPLLRLRRLGADGLSEESGSEEPDPSASLPCRPGAGTRRCPCLSGRCSSV